jgi:prepilin-type N-terminal cleavage/methylation domain-containing protein
MSSAETRRGRDGFTLIELTVALVISGLLATVVFQLIQGQGRFVAMESAREEVQQNTRGALELIASELRTIPAGGIEAAAAQQVRFKLPRAWGVMCDAPGTGAIGVVFPPGTFPTDFPASFGGSTEWGLAIPSGATAGEYVAATLSSVSTANGNCLALGTAAGAADIRQLGYSGLSGASTAAAQSTAFVYQTVEYDASTSSGVSGVWLRRSNGAGSPQPMAGPLLAPDNATSSSGGLAFTYFCGASALTATQLAVAANLRTVDRIRVKIAMQSRNRTNSGRDEASRQTQTDSITVHLRNTTGGIACPV